ncbi:transposase [Lentibacillus sp. CBA3610]|uniref:REP-associated tyrosine transposase n=1 Tax=Lentibacillus sp. CBA3610 TaxID=2518176 RepID=UPI001595EBE3|nr:transposase [Lentibacillus sp. CBA3610]QKY70371.1 transposase [Lentibacillus sp. CBA3610]
MSRKPRVWYPGAVYHITARGNRRDSIFYDPDDYQHYMGLIASCMEDISFILHAYCLMPNHIHLLLETKEVPLGAIIKFIHTRYAIYFNKRHDFTGHVFQGRYYAKLIDSTDYFLRASRYIHLNPVESEIVTEPKNYVWSSYPEYMAEAKNSTLLETGRVLSYFQEPQKENYCTYVESSEPEESDATLTN